MERTGPPSHLEMLYAAGFGPLGGPRPGPTIVGSHTSEERIYRGLGFEPIPAPARTGKAPPPGLVQLGDLKGDLRAHTDWSPDGRQTISQLLDAARRRGLEYVAITDHAKGLRFGGLDISRLHDQRTEIDALRASGTGVAILHGAELNIARDGSLDYEDEQLDWLDFTVAAVHSHFGLGVDEQTERVLRAVAHPRVHVIAHLIGRRIGNRAPIELDVPAIFSAAAAHGSALEVNGHLDRLDLSARMVDLALKHGCLLAAASDAHRSAELANVDNAIGTMQRSHVVAASVVNTWSLPDLLNWVAGSDRRPERMLR